MPRTARFTHQYIDRASGCVRDERLTADSWIRLLYHPLRENMPELFRTLTSRRASQLLGALNFDLNVRARWGGARRLLEALGADPGECHDPLERLTTARQVFERKIRYWECRPLPYPPQAIVSPADARVLVGSLAEDGALFLKDKFFRLDELLGEEKADWRRAFAGGDYAIFRLTPEKYHYNHTPVSGRVVDLYTVDGSYHACNPAAVVAALTPYSKNKRVVTIFDTDVPGGSGVGLVAMVEIVALMIGGIDQCYSRERYDAPQAELVGAYLEKGCPKSVYRPGSSTDVLLFEPGRVRFATDLLTNQRRADVASRFTRGFRQPLVETDIMVRSLLAWPADLPQGETP